jgi:hypothetical protein
LRHCEPPPPKCEKGKVFFFFLVLTLEDVSSAQHKQLAVSHRRHGGGSRQIWLRQRVGVERGSSTPVRLIRTLEFSDSLRFRGFKPDALLLESLPARLCEA